MASPGAGSVNTIVVARRPPRLNSARPSSARAEESFRRTAHRTSASQRTFHSPSASGARMAADNKGKREELVKLHPGVVDHLRRLAGFTAVVFY